MENEFKSELMHLFNKHSIDARVGIPDFILADHIINEIANLEILNTRRREYVGGR